MGKFVRISKKNDPRLKRIAKDLQNGALVVFPTETVYGLGANAFDAVAVKRIFAAKNRPADNPLIVHIAKKNQLNQIVQKIPASAQKLMRRFWPGPLTILFKKQKTVPDVVTAGLSTVAVRMPCHAIARRLIELSMVPIAAPSANLATRPSATRALHAAHDLLSRVDWLIDSGASPLGVESTIIDCTKRVPVLLRPGKITREQLQKTIGQIRVFASKKKVRPLAPGMRYWHYAPKAPVWVVPSKKLERVIFYQQKNKEQRIAVIARTNTKIPASSRLVLFRFSSLSKLAHDLFYWFRAADQIKADLILVQAVSEKGLGLAIMNRLKKAASKIVD